MSLPVKIYASEVEFTVEDSAKRKFTLKGNFQGTLDPETKTVEGSLSDAKLDNIDLTYPRKVKQAIKILEELI